MSEYLFSDEQLRPLPVHFRYMRRNTAAQVAELGTEARASSSRQHQLTHYRQQELYKPVSELDYGHWEEFARSFQPPAVAAGAAESAAVLSH
ncbi:hypothetical protein EJV47_24000 [Hymenobacter gummosus]|uniref:Uncharacterized protein n=1 Tax=Hymenobacter gummosus TaxID=1776032 RepID=A0A3S0IJU5_9BACT|nr:hypothetical protein [Hymenobacter gummosus]RTQ45895.1 hypothetical protein EJV47_24000 [Hymenobacter gummosus]